MTPNLLRNTEHFYNKLLYHLGAMWKREYRRYSYYYSIKNGTLATLSHLSTRLDRYSGLIILVSAVQPELKPLANLTAESCFAVMALFWLQLPDKCPLYALLG